MYSIRIVALAVGTTAKWVDNLVTSHSLPGVRRRTRGVTRLVDNAGLGAIAICHALVNDLRIPVANAIELACQAAESQHQLSRLTLLSGLVVEIPVEAIVRRTRERLVDAIEATSHIRRGRPRVRSQHE